MVDISVSWFYHYYKDSCLSNQEGGSVILILYRATVTCGLPQCWLTAQRSKPLCAMRTEWYQLADAFEVIKQKVITNSKGAF
jgi:hypothetical protein